MSTVTLSSFPSAEDMLQYNLPTNNSTYSTISSYGEVQQPIKLQMNMQTPKPEGEPIFGSHIREAVDIVRDWARTR